MPKGVNIVHQQDAEARDRALRQEDARRSGGAQGQPYIKILTRYTYNEDLQNSLQKMDQELKGLIVRPRPRSRSHAKKPLAVDIKEIGAVGFHYNLRKKENEVFVTSLYEIDRLIEEALYPEDEDEETREEIDKRLPAAYKDYIDVFSKVASDQLPPHRSYDHKIQLEADHNLGFHLLYKQTADELIALKQYLIENLGKRFIEQSQAPFASLVLFVKKPNGGLRFCIDFWKLNAITRKD